MMRRKPYTVKLADLTSGEYSIALLARNVYNDVECADCYLCGERIVLGLGSVFVAKRSRHRHSHCVDPTVKYAPGYGPY